jgi:hypothetical protein
MWRELLAGDEKDRVIDQGLAAGDDAAASSTFRRASSGVMMHRKPKCIKPVSGGHAMRAAGR